MNLDVVFPVLAKIREEYIIAPGGGVAPGGELEYSTIRSKAELRIMGTDVVKPAPEIYKYL